MRYFENGIDAARASRTRTEARGGRLQIQSAVLCGFMRTGSPKAGPPRSSTVEGGPVGPARGRTGYDGQVFSNLSFTPSLYSRKGCQVATPIQLTATRVARERTGTRQGVRASTKQTCQRRAQRGSHRVRSCRAAIRPPERGAVKSPPHMSRVPILFSATPRGALPRRSMNERSLESAVRVRR